MICELGLRALGRGLGVRIPHAFCFLLFRDSIFVLLRLLPATCAHGVVCGGCELSGVNRMLIRACIGAAVRVNGGTTRSP